MVSFAQAGGDFDRDGLLDVDETGVYGTDPTRVDSDGDGIRDGVELSSGSDPTDPTSLPSVPSIFAVVSSGQSTAGSSISIGEGVGGCALGTNDCSAAVHRIGYDPARSAATRDLDLDGTVAAFDLDDSDPLATAPRRVTDTDGDRFPDVADTDDDNDGLSDVVEVSLGSDPLDPDTDNDGLIDGDEVARQTNPLNADSDGDTLSDGDEVANGTNPLEHDSDFDGLSDALELALQTQPNQSDSDGDGLQDGAELLLGRDPTVPDFDGQTRIGQCPVAS